MVIQQLLTLRSFKTIKAVGSVARKWPLQRKGHRRAEWVVEPSPHLAELINSWKHTQCYFLSEISLTRCL